MLKRYIPPVILMAALAGCAGVSAKNTVAAIEDGIAAADRFALDYVNLPACDGSTVICSDTEHVMKIDQGRQTAKILAYKAEAAVWDPNASGDATQQAVLAASQALAAMREIIPIITPTLTSDAATLTAAVTKIGAQ